VSHELRAYNESSGKLEQLSYWRLLTGVEVDFVVGDMLLAHGAKSSQNIITNHCKNLREVLLEYPAVKKRIVVYTGNQRRKTEDDMEIIPYHEFARSLWAGELF